MRREKGEVEKEKPLYLFILEIFVILDIFYLVVIEIFNILVFTHSRPKAAYPLPCRGGRVYPQPSR